MLYDVYIYLQEYNIDNFPNLRKYFVQNRDINKNIFHLKLILINSILI